MSMSSSIDVLLKEVLRRNSTDIAGVMVASKDGLPIGYRFSEEAFDPSTVAAYMAALAEDQVKVTGQLGLGEVKTTIIEALKGKLILKEEGNHLIAIIAYPDANLGLIMIEMNRLAENLRQAMNPR